MDLKDYSLIRLLDGNSIAGGKHNVSDVRVSTRCVRTMLKGHIPMCPVEGNVSSCRNI